ncbi:kelch-like protein 20 [Oscarella lobularis]|uniref:kelch-like protein 20 n=1 Tax=Oscarella lobularis TaxID=121494 RepID=UPI0033141539
MNEAISLETKGYFSTALFDSFRESDYLCDVTIISKDGQRFPAHRIILASASPFFRVMFKGSFKESNQADVTLSNVDGTVTKMLIEYAYTGKTECPSSSLLFLYEAANYVQFDGLSQMCNDWLKRHVDESSCIGMGIVADRCGNSDLLQLAGRIAAMSISVLAESEDFLLLSAEHLSRILSHDELGVKSEDEVLTIFQKWVKHDEESRRAQVETLSKFVRFPLLDFEESSAVLSDLDLISHYHSSSESGRRRFGLDGVLLVAGGLQPITDEISDFEIVCNRARVYEPNCDKWTPFPPLALDVYCHKMAISNDVLYALGGNTENDPNYDSLTNIVQRYDGERRQWVNDVERMSRRRIDREIVCCDGCIYGMSISCDEMTCEVLDSEKKVWIPVSSPKKALSGDFILPSLANKVFAFGYNVQNRFGYTKYDRFEDRWSKFKSCPRPSLLDPASEYVTMGDRLYIFCDNNRAAVIFDSRDERFSVVDDFCPFPSCNGFVYDPESKRMFTFTDDEMGVYDERVNKWDIRDCNLGFRSFDLVLVERKLMLDFV